LPHKKEVDERGERIEKKKIVREIDDKRDTEEKKSEKVEYEANL
jgi:hypothetical protein